MIDRCRRALRDVFGYDSFRHPQEDVIASLLSGRDAFAHMPTGGGKSLCFQIPSIVMDGTGVVVSPLIALMDDQVAALRQAGVRAGALHSGVKFPELLQTERDYRARKLDVLYIAPERALKEGFSDFLRQGKVALFAIDESHCVSQWGHDFRKEYLDLPALMRQFPEVPRLALTATADPPTQREILSRLELRDPGIFQRTMDRPNLFYRISPKEDAHEQLLRFIRDKHPDHAGIVYRTSRKSVEACQTFLVKNGIPALCYHAGLSSDTKRENLERFVRDEGIVMVATIAFGMGIDKPDVRFVAHLDLPKSLEGWVQETGRAGRDGLLADAWMVWGLEDLFLLRGWIEEGEATPERKRLEHGKLNQLVALCESPGCRRQAFLPFFGEAPGEPCGHCDRCVEPPVREDATRPSRMLLSAIRRTGERFGGVHLIHVLRGKDNAKVIQLDHHRLPTFGVGAEYTEAQWRTWIRQLVATGFLRQDLEAWGALKITDKGEDLLFGRCGVRLEYLPPEEPKTRKRKGEKKAAAKAVSTGGDLEAALRKERKAHAQEQGVPPYVLFHDKTLFEIVERKPKSVQELLDVPGMGQKRVEAMSDWILSLVKQHG